MPIYPPKISERFRAPMHSGRADAAAADGISASFVCGAFIGMSLSVDDAGRIADARFRTNGCGFMVAGADALVDHLAGKSLTDLHGLDGDELHMILQAELDDFPPERRQCADVVFEALRKALAGYRQKLLEEFQGEKALAGHRQKILEEFQGEKALICTCFGVTEEDIVAKISTLGLTEIEDVVGVTRAGSGCGSCRMMIQELLDNAD